MGTFGIAADLIEQHGWTRYDAANCEGCMCVGGAIAMAVGLPPEAMYAEEDYPSLAELFHRFGDFVGARKVSESSGIVLAGFTRVYRWNDFRAQDGQHAISVLRELDAGEADNGRP